MRKTLHYEVTKEAIEKEPQVTDSLTKEQRDVVLLFFVEGLNQEGISKKLKMTLADVKKVLGAAKRKLYVRCLSLLANNSEQSLTASPQEIWGADATMKEFMKEWVDIGIIMERLVLSPNPSQRDMLVRSIFDYCKKHRGPLVAILEHAYTRKR